VNAAGIEDLENRRYAAMTGKDLTALAALLHEDLVYTHSSGAVDTKASYLEALASGRLSYLRATRSDTLIRLHGGCALISGRSAIDILLAGAPKSLALCYLAVWTGTADGWRLVGWQSAPVPA
jgi:ketosteroid isomerase-like protein